MFPLSCARVNTSHGISAHKKTWSTHDINVPSKNVFAHISYTLFQSQMSPGKCCTKEILCTRRLSKIRGTMLHTVVVQVPRCCHVKRFVDQRSISIQLHHCVYM